MERVQILRGNLTELVKNINNKFKKAVSPTPTPTLDIVKPPTFMPIKDKIKQMEHNNRLEAEKNEFEQIFKEVTTHARKSPRIESIEQNKQSPEFCEEEEKTDDEKSVEGCGGGRDDYHYDFSPPPTNGSGGVPPKPLPRTSRTNSMTESNSLEEMAANRPQPKPRTTAYKVRQFATFCTVYF